MFMDFVCDHNSNQLGDSGKQQIGMKRFFVLGFPAGNTKTVFEVADGFLHIYTYFVSGIPFFSATDCSGVSTEILFWIHVYHSSTGRRCTGVITMADTSGFFRCFVVFPFHFWADKLHGWKPAAQVGFTAFPFHWKREVIRAAGNPFFIHMVVNPFDFELVF